MLDFNDPSQSEDAFLFQAHFRYHRHQPRQVRAEIQLSSEPYNLDAPADLDIVPVGQRQGERVYFAVTLYVLEKQIILKVQLHNEPAPDQSIGQVISSELDPGQPVRQHPCGSAQGWFYPADRLLVIWECMLSPQFSDASLLEDSHMELLWKALEVWGGKRFPDAQRVTTPFRDPQYADEEYQEFLSRLGYQPVAKAAYGKTIAREAS